MGADVRLENLLRCFALDEAGRIVGVGEGRVDVGGLLATAAHIRPAALCERDRDFESGCLQRGVIDEPFGSQMVRRCQICAPEVCRHLSGSGH